MRKNDWLKIIGLIMILLGIGLFFIPSLNFTHKECINFAIHQIKTGNLSGTPSNFGCSIMVAIPLCVKFALMFMGIQLLFPKIQLKIKEVSDWFDKKEMQNEI